MSGGDVATLKSQLEGWREIILITDSVLGWDKEWFPAVTSVSLTSVFLMLWYQDPSVVTLIAILGLMVTLLDYAAPRVQAKLFPETAWTGDKERRLEKICQSVVFVRAGLWRLLETLAHYRDSAPIIYLSSVVFSLYFLAYLGSLFSGFFLSYVSLLVVLMIPGLHRRGLLEKYCAGLTLKIGEYVKGKKLE